MRKRHLLSPSRHPRVLRDKTDLSRHRLNRVAASLTPFGLNKLSSTFVDGKSVLLIGHAGSYIWPHFKTWLAEQNPAPENPLDTWSKSIIGAVAADVGGHSVFPSDTPYMPFQQWAMRAEGLKPSPLGILIHPVYGLWHAYRGAIVFDDEVLIQAAEEMSHPSDLCVRKPCLSACPVGAFSGEGYDVSACRSHLAAEAGDACMSGGCGARLACPVGTEFAYADEQMRFHMRVFVK
jgi:hypothetical protein